jgi:hypothetical protein
MRVGIAAFAMLNFMIGCASPPPAHTPEYYACVDGCAREKDACMLEAPSAQAVNACDDQSQRCGEVCR